MIGTLGVWGAWHRPLALIVIQCQLPGHLEIAAGLPRSWIGTLRANRGVSDGLCGSFPRLTVGSESEARQCLIFPF